MTPPPADDTRLPRSADRAPDYSIDAAGSGHGANAQSPKRKPSLRVILIGVALVIVAAIALVVGLNFWSEAGASARRTRPTVTVGTAQAQKGDLPLILNALGTATPTATVTVNARVSGTLVKVNFTEGDHVKLGQVLAEVDPRPYQAALDQAEGQLARDTAQLQNAKIDADRYQTLLKQDSVSRQQADTQAALVKQDEGIVAADRANVDAARINLGYTKITAPIAGRAGLRLIDAGNYIGAGGSTGIVVLTQTQPIDVVFTLPEDQAPQVVARLKAGATLDVTALDRAGTKEIDHGSLSTLDNVIDVATGTVRAKARFANAQEEMLANQFVNVRLLADTLKDAVIVPASAIRQGPKGEFVWVLKDDHTATMRQIKRGPTNGEQASIAEGLQVGETVITEGGDNLREGAPVTLPGQNGRGPGAAGARGQRGAGAGPDGQGGQNGQGGQRRNGQHRRPGGGQGGGQGGAGGGQGGGGGGQGGGGQP